MKTGLRIITLSLIATLSLAVFAHKKPLDHEALNDWKTLRNVSLSRDGRWSAFTVTPLEGDGILSVRNTKTGKQIDIPRGYNPKFTADGRWLVASVKPLFKATRQAKIDKKKDFDMPQDSLAIVNLATGNVEKIASVKGFALGEDAGDWVAYVCVDTLYIKGDKLKDKEAGKPLIVRNLPTGKQKVVKNVRDYTMDKQGRHVAFSLKKAEKDTTATDGIGVISLSDTTLTLIDRDKLHYGAPVFNEAGTMLAYTADNDSAKSGTRRMKMMLSDLSMRQNEPEEIISAITSNGKELSVNQFTIPQFSHDGRRLIVGVAPIIAPDDTTIVDFERADLDIWRWDAPQTPPQELKNVEKTRKKTFPLVVDLKTRNHQLITDNQLVTIEEPNRWDSDWALITDPTDNIISWQWDYYAPVEMQIVNVNTGERRSVGTAYRDDAKISPSGKYVYWYKDHNYHAYNIATGDSVNLTEAIPYPVWDEENDRPSIAEPYTAPIWSENDNDVLLFDKHDIWSVDPTGKRAPICLTNGEGRKQNLRFRIIDLDPDARFVKPGEELLLNVFNFENKRNGLATIKFGKAANPSVKTLDEYQFTQVRKAKNANVYTFSRQNFQTSPDLYISNGTDFAKAQKVSDINPQMRDYRMGHAELVKWRAFDGQELEGVIYIPDDIEPSEKLPMLSVFYELNSEELYRHYRIEPSWSWVNYPFYVSRGYVIFVPDVRYTAGIPGESAYNCIVSGVEEMLRKYPFIDRDRLGIDGQSWGGYQTAYLITRTNMFACAGSGAPVANMTSAFGGIRWSTGDSRQAQYEQGQSRIGRNLWEAPELYVANSPLFRLNKVETPLLIMHNDADGAVPWYQGIELFMGLRRLHKPVWMLQYNGEAHNLRETKNCKDITIRLQQFFDHYLQGVPMPEWMVNGIPAIRKGQELGY